MLTLSLPALSSPALAQPPILDNETVEEQLRFFEFLAQSVVETEEVITPVDLQDETHTDTHKEEDK